MTAEPKAYYLPDDLAGALTHVQEECAELIAACCKAQRFGLDNFHPDDPSRRTNEEDIVAEFHDIRVAMEELVRLALDVRRPHLNPKFT
jgi:hypothetical protein